MFYQYSWYCTAGIFVLLCCEQFLVVSVFMLYVCGRTLVWRVCLDYMCCCVYPVKWNLNWSEPHKNDIIFWSLFVTMNNWQLEVSDKSFTCSVFVCISVIVSAFFLIFLIFYFFLGGGREESDLIFNPWEILQSQRLVDMYMLLYKAECCSEESQIYQLNICGSVHHA